MGEQELTGLQVRPGVAAWRMALARRVESRRVQHFVVEVILFNVARSPAWRRARLN